MGIVNVNDISDFSFSMEELGGKKAYIKNISQRKGLPKVCMYVCMCVRTWGHMHSCPPGTC